MTNDIYKVAKPRMNTSCQNIVSADSDYQSSQPCLEHIAMSQHRDLDVTKRDRFELLSAYLDGEVSPEERRLVTTWLADDPETQCLYQRLLHLRLERRYRNPVSDLQQSKSRSLANQETGFLAILNRCSSITPRAPAQDAKNPGFFCRVNQNP
jgi:hypothetical protein